MLLVPVCPRRAHGTAAASTQGKWGPWDGVEAAGTGDLLGFGYALAPALGRSLERRGRALPRHEWFDVTGNRPGACRRSSRGARAPPAAWASAGTANERDWG